MTDDLLVLSDGYMECGIDKRKQVFCQLEILLVRTIIDNQMPCDKSCTGTREEYEFEEESPMLLMRQIPQRPCPPPNWDATLRRLVRVISRHNTFTTPNMKICYSNNPTLAAILTHFRWSNDSTHHNAQLFHLQIFGHEQQS